MSRRHAGAIQHGVGALNLQEWTMQEWTNTEEMPGVEIAGVDNDGGKTQQMDNDGVELSSRFTVADIACLLYTSDAADILRV